MAIRLYGFRYAALSQRRSEAFLLRFLMRCTKMKCGKLALTFGLLCLGTAAQAALIDRGNGLIYDNVLDVTWLQDANYAVTSGYAIANAVNHGTGARDNIYPDGRMGWDAAVAWVDQLIFRGYADWRLPTVAPIDGIAFQYVFSNNATTDTGYAETTTNGTDGSWRNGAGDSVSY